MDQTPIEKIIAESGLRDVARAIYNNRDQTAACYQCGTMTKCDAAWEGKFVCLACYDKLLPVPRP
jgi:hypothetical protein